MVVIMKIERYMSFFIIICIITTVLCSCHEQKKEQTEQNGDVFTSDTTFSICGTNSLNNSEIAESRNTEGTETVPSVPYTIKHTVTDMSEYLPKFPLDMKLSGGGADVSVKNSFLKDDILYVLSEKTMDGQHSLQLYPLHADGTFYEAEIITVPETDGMNPIYAYPLRDNRLVTIYEKCEFNEEELREYAYYFVYIITYDGTVLAEASLDNSFQYKYIRYFSEFLIHEDRTGLVSILFQGNDTIVLFEYDSERNEITKIRTFYNTTSVFFSPASSFLLDHRKFLYMGSADHSSILDMDTGLLKKYALRIPKRQAYMNLTMDTQGAFYLKDLIGLYQYKEDGAPIQIADWSKCGLSYAMEGPQNLWVVNDHTFFIADTKTGSRKTINMLYLIQTEKVLQEDFRQLIDIEYCTIYDTWFNDAVIKFNMENEKYRVVPHYLDMNGVSEESYLAMVQDDLLYKAHPDIILTKLPFVSLQHLYDKGTFLDLSSYFKENLLGCVKEAIQYNGALYSIPMGMEMETFVSPTVAVNGFLTWDVFYNKIDTLEDGEILTSEKVVKEHIFDNGIMDFIDKKNKTAMYDSGTFRRMVLYTASLEDVIDETAGYLISQSDRSTGYTNPTLPRRIAEGGICFINVQLSQPDNLMTTKLLFGDTDYTWCGYPSNDGGGAYLKVQDRYSVLADTDVKEGCIEFLSYLLSDKQQIFDTHKYMPVTVSGIRAMIKQNRYGYYPIEAYHVIGDPTAKLRMPSIGFGGDPVGYINLSPAYLTENPVDPVEYTETISYIDSETGIQIVKEFPRYQMVEYTEKETEEFLYFLNNCHMKANTDPTLRTIVEEELSYWQGGISSLADASEKIQSRVWIYLNE